MKRELGFLHTEHSLRGLRTEQIYRFLRFGEQNRETQGGAEKMESRVELCVEWDVAVDVASSNCVLDLAIMSVN